MMLEDILLAAQKQSSAQKHLTLMEEGQETVASRRERLMSFWIKAWNEVWNESSPKPRRSCRTCGNKTRADCAHSVYRHGHYIRKTCGGCGKSGHRASDCNEDPVPIKMKEKPEFLKRKELKEAEVAAFKMKKLEEVEGASVKRKKNSTGSSSSKGEVPSKEVSNGGVGIGMN